MDGSGHGARGRSLHAETGRLVPLKSIGIIPTTIHIAGDAVLQADETQYTSNTGDQIASAVKHAGMASGQIPIPPGIIDRYVHPVFRHSLGEIFCLVIAEIPCDSDRKGRYNLLGVCEGVSAYG